MGVHPLFAIRLGSLNLPNTRSKAAAAPPPPPPPPFPFLDTTRRSWAALDTRALANLMALLRWKQKHAHCASCWAGWGVAEPFAWDGHHCLRPRSISLLLCLLLGKMPRQELPLPERWEEARDYDIDHTTKTTSWVDPQDSHWAGLFGLGLPQWPPACLLRSVADREGAGQAA
ncbi:protein KIBRA [Crotalus adamanteus]|uniref:Protein KIBRA n=1 Tax=Crotalus adamanteus TaxID=8729 RepID=A0AAW1B3H3_CROAD